MQPPVLVGQKKCSLSVLFFQDQLAQCETRVKEKTAQLNELILQVRTMDSHAQCTIVGLHLVEVMAMESNQAGIVHYVLPNACV